MITRRVVQAFEVWDPTLETVAIMNAGAVLRMIRIVLHQDIGAGRPPIQRAVEFESGGARYCSGFDRLWENTLPEDLPLKSGIFE